jgi:hypothetical protein
LLVSPTNPNMLESSGRSSLLPTEDIYLYLHLFRPLVFRAQYPLIYYMYKISL